MCKISSHLVVHVFPCCFSGFTLITWEHITENQDSLKYKYRCRSRQKDRIYELNTCECHHKVKFHLLKLNKKQKAKTHACTFCMHHFVEAEFVNPVKKGCIAILLRP